MFVVNGAKRLRKMSLDDVPNGISLLAVATFRLSRGLKSEVTRVVSQDKEVNLVSWRVLVGLSLVSSANQIELVEFTRTEQAQLSRVLVQMSQRGLITSRLDVDDRRSRVFSMTSKGTEKYQRLSPSVTNLSNALDGALKPDEQMLFLSMCERIMQASIKTNQTNPKNGSQSTVQMEEI
jgi:DNA-binding MarR family transcriptional regulator